MSIHNKAKINEITKNVIMPGDPLRAKYIAENFLENYKLVNDVRNNYAYTGKYRGKDITVMASGMGMPSMGIYSYELFKIYNVENIIRIGSCGAYKNNIKLRDLILVDKCYTLGNYSLGFDGIEKHLVESDKNLNTIIEKQLIEKNIKYVKGNTACTECFDPYIDDVKKIYELFPQELNIIGSEMEAFALLYNAKKLNKKAACILTVVDSIYEKTGLSAEERELSLNDMIVTALDTIIEL